MPRISTPGMRFYYQQAGQGPDVVLIHGLTGNLAIWPLINLIDVLAADFRVTAYDLRGHGYSDTPPTGYTSADLAHDLRQLQISLGLGPSYLLGHSFGGVIAMHAAVLYPQAVQGVILSDPYFPALRHLETDITRWAGWETFKAQARDAGMDMEAAPWWNLEDCLQQAGKLSGQSRENFTQILGQPALQRLIRLMPTTCGADSQELAGLTAERLLSIRQPVLCLYGEESPFLSTCRFLEENLADCKVALVPGARHMAHEENGPAYVELVRTHLRQMAGMEGSWKAAQCEPAGGVPCT
jgi:pimeloyl-ACP methyl ester carboxylesterase